MRGIQGTPRTEETGDFLADRKELTDIQYTENVRKGEQK